MPHEILDGQQLHSLDARPADHESESDSGSSDSDSDSVLSESGSDSDADDSVLRPPVVHNFQHDLESVWWIVLWTCTLRVNYEPSRTWARTIFRNSNKLCRERELCFTSPIRGTLRKKLQANLKVFAAPLDKIRNHLKTTYQTRERKNQLEVPGSYARIHRLFVKFFSTFQNKDQAWRNVRFSERYDDPTSAAPSGPQPSMSVTDAPIRVGKRPLEQEDEDEKEEIEVQPDLLSRLRSASKRSKRDHGNN